MANIRIRFLGALIVFILAAFAIPANNLHAQTVNLIQNPSFETLGTNNNPANWTKLYWGSPVPTFKYLNTGRTGRKSASVTFNKRSTGDARWSHDPVVVQAGVSYTYSNWYKSNVATEIDAKLTDTNGKVSYIFLKSLPSSSNNWKEATLTLTIPAGITKVTIFHLISKKGTLTVDDFSLVKVGGTTPPPPPASTTTSPTLALTASPSTIQKGATSTLSWTSTNTTSCNSLNSWTTSHATSGSQAVSPTATKTYAMSCLGGGLSVSQQVTVTVTATTTPPPSPPAPTGPNLISNPSLEIADPNNSALPQNWQNGGWGTNTAVFTYPVSGKDGQKGVRIDVSSYTDGDARWQFEDIPVTPGDTYNFSDWYQSNVISYPVVKFTNTDGSIYYLGLRAAPASLGWAQFSESFQVPYKAKTMTVFHVIKENGTLTTDNYSLIKFFPKGFNRPIITLTFDNGFEDNITTVIPLLDQYGMKVTYCYSTEYIEGRVPNQIPVVQEISSRGHESCSHSLYHSNNMTKLTVPELDYELSHSKTYLQSITGEPINNFLTPFGAYNDTVVNEIKKYYRAHRTTDENYNTQENFDPYRLAVQNMRDTTTLAEFKSWIDQAVKDKSWLILVYHRVAPAPIGSYDTPVNDFEPQLQIIKNSGITVTTMDKALDELIPQLEN